MEILNLLNSTPMYLICGSIVLFVALVCVLFMVRAYRAGKRIGMDIAKMKRVIVFSATFTLLPSIGILLGVIALSGSLGTPWPWLRLSVIGALHYETQVAQAAAEQVGMSTLSAAEMTPGNFTTIALLMSICIMWGMILSFFFNRRYLAKLGQGGNKEKSRSGGFGDTGNGRFSFSGSLTPIIVALVSGAVMAMFIYGSEKKQIAWLESFSVAGSMIVGMMAAVLLG